MDGIKEFDIVSNIGNNVKTEFNLRMAIVKTVEDFLSYANSKFDRYEWQLSWYLSYTGFDLTGISNFAALYNGGTKSGNVILPNNESYLFFWPFLRIKIRRVI